MSEQILSSTGPLDGARFSAGPDLHLRPADDCARFSLRIAQAHLDKASEAFGFDIPNPIGAMSSSGETSALCLGPDEWLLLAPAGEAPEIAARFAALSVTHSLVDVGHRSVGIDVSGAAAALALAAGCPLDLEAMAAGGCTRTILDKAEVVLMKLERDRYRLEIARSFAEFVWIFLSHAGREFGGTSDRTGFMYQNNEGGRA